MCLPIRSISCGCITDYPEAISTQGALGVEISTAQRHPYRGKWLVGDAYVGDVDAESGGEGDLVVLLLEQDFADVLRCGELA
jgi:hypothetical protein